MTALYTRSIARIFSSERRPISTVYRLFLRGAMDIQNNLHCQAGRPYSSSHEQCSDQWAHKNGKIDPRDPGLVIYANIGQMMRLCSGWNGTVLAYASTSYSVVIFSTLFSILSTFQLKMVCPIPISVTTMYAHQKWSEKVPVFNFIFSSRAHGQVCCMERDYSVYCKRL